MAIPPFVSIPLAGVVPFDNSTNGFVSDNVQNAIEEAFAGAVFNSKFTFHLAALSSLDKVIAITYLDSGLKAERIDQITYSSVADTRVNVVKTVYWLDVGTMNQRIEKEEYVGTIFSPDSLRKVYAYASSGIRYRRTGYSLEIF